MMAPFLGLHVYFADSNALKGTLIEYLQEVKPCIMLAVPRVYEKMEEKVREALQERPRIMNWALGAGRSGTDAIMKGESPGMRYWLFNKLVFSKVRAKLGLDNCVYFISGAAPLSQRTRNFFFNLGMFISNTYGMSETSGPMSGLYPEDFPTYNLKSAGKKVEGGDIVIESSGEACFFGRNVFMGYLNNDEATMKTIDGRGLLHSGDIGELDKHGNFSVTGRIKELIVTAGGENVAPIFIEELFK